MSQLDRVLVLGANGTLGIEVVKTLTQFAPDFKLVLQASSKFSRNVDLYRFLSENAAGTIINCIGYFGSDPAEHLKVNGCLPRVIADWCDANGALCIHISTNAIFEPDNARLWTPDDQPNPRTPYEVSKAYGEDPRSYIFRTSFIGVSRTGKDILSTLIKGGHFANKVWNGVTVSTLARRIVDVVISQHGVPKAFLEHVHSPEPTSFNEIAKFLGSTSRTNGSSNDARLLGGGLILPSIFEQLEQQRSALKSPVTKL